MPGEVYHWRDVENKQFRYQEEGGTKADDDDKAHNKKSKGMEHSALLPFYFFTFIRTDSQRRG